MMGRQITHLWPIKCILGSFNLYAEWCQAAQGRRIVWWLRKHQLEVSKLKCEFRLCYLVAVSY